MLSLLLITIAQPKNGWCALTKSTEAPPIGKRPLRSWGEDVRDLFLPTSAMSGTRERQMERRRAKTSFHDRRDVITVSSFGLSYWFGRLPSALNFSVRFLKNVALLK